MLFLRVSRKQNCAPFYKSEARFAERGVLKECREMVAETSVSGEDCETVAKTSAPEEDRECAGEGS